MITYRKVVVAIAGLALIDVLDGDGWWFDWIAIPWGIFLVGHAVAVCAGRRFLGAEWEQRKVDKYFAGTTTCDAANCAPLDHLV